MNCPRCQTQLRPGARFCPNCGFTLSQPPSPPPSHQPDDGSWTPPPQEQAPPPGYQPSPGATPPGYQTSPGATPPYPPPPSQQPSSYPPVAPPAQPSTPAKRFPLTPFLCIASFLVGLIIGVVVGALLLDGGPKDATPTPEPASTDAAAMPTAVLEPDPTPSAAPADSTATPSIGTQIGQTAPDLVLPNLDGTQVNLGDLRGRVVVLTFWKLDDFDSEAMMPHLKRYHQDHKDDPGLALLTINSGSPADAVRALSGANGWEFDILLDEGSQKTSEYAVGSWPTTFFLDRDGIIRDRVEGVLNNEEVYRRASGL